MRIWIEHFGRGFGWSVSGLQILFRGEVAARMELAGAALGLVWLGWIGRSWQEIGLFGLVCLLTLAVEAMNTAVEAIVDEISPGRSEFARRAKDLGSAAVFFMLTAAGLTLVALTIASALGR